MRAIAINVGANTNEPGFRGPIRADGRFKFLPIPETKSTSEPVPTYGDLAPKLSTQIPASVESTPVHLDPEFAGYPFCENYTYGDDHGVKAGPLSSLETGDYVFFYATLSVAESAAWLPPEWGAFLIGQFRLASDPLSPGKGESALTMDRLHSHKDLHERFANNAHVKRDPLDAAVLLAGSPADSRLYSRARPLSSPAGGTEPNDVVLEHSTDSGRGPWWRRPLRFDAESTETLLGSLALSPDKFQNYHG